MDFQSGRQACPLRIREGGKAITAQSLQYDEGHASAEDIALDLLNLLDASAGVAEELDSCDSNGVQGGTEQLPKLVE